MPSGEEAEQVRGQGIERAVAGDRKHETPRRALLHEARLGALLQHPNVVGTFGISEHDGTFAVALELVRGASIAEILAATDALPPRAVLDVGVSVLSAPPQRLTECAA